jgi:colicin import membrane protein
MSKEGTGSKAAEIAAQYVESIVAAAEDSAGQLQEEARKQADEIRAKARRDAESELDRARKKAAELGQEARQSASAQVETAEKEAHELREETRREIEGRVAEAEQAASQVLEEARTLSSGLRQLGSSLQSQGERILRDVLAAHKQMQADLRVSMPEAPAPTRRTRAAERREGPEAGTGPTATPEERAAIERAASELRDAPRTSGRRRGNPFDDLDVPSWIER